MILVNYSEETLNTMSKQQLIDYITLLKSEWSRTIQRLDNNIKYTDSLIKENERNRNELDEFKNIWYQDKEILLKEIEVLKGKQ